MSELRSNYATKDRETSKSNCESKSCARCVHDICWGDERHLGTRRDFWYICQVVKYTKYAWE